MNTLPIYLDYNATTPVDPAVVDEMLPYLTDHFGNPSCGHVYGRLTRQAVDEGRKKVANLIGAAAEEIIFTSGGSESNNHAIRGAIRDRKKGSHLITTAIEHPAVSDVFSYLGKRGCSISIVPVDKYGIVDPENIRTAIRENTVLISVMHANNEVGSIQPIREISQIAHVHDILVHTDAAQSIGKIPVNVDELGVDLLSLAGHKLYAPKGIGALFIRKGVNIQKLMLGADHESGHRAGTENVACIAGLGKACEMISYHLTEHTEKMTSLRNRLEAGICQALPDVVINGHPELRLPNTSSLSFSGYKANILLDKLDKIAASAGAACHSDTVNLSAVLTAMNVPRQIGMGTIRFSVGRLTTEAEIDAAIHHIVQTVQQLSME